MSGFTDRETKRKSRGVAGAMIQPQEPERRADPPQAEARQSGKGRPKAERETKKRVTLTLLPSLYDQVQKIAYVERRSASDIVAECLADYVAAHGDTLAEYENLKGD